MKYSKMVGLAGLAATAMLAFAGTASATTITAPSGTAYTGTEYFHTVEKSVIVFDGVTEVSCQTSEIHRESSTHGSGVTAKGNVKTLTFTNCNGDTVVVSKAGSVEIHAVSPAGNGTFTSSGAEITIIADTIFGNIHCIFTTSSTHIGTITAAPSNTGHATMHIDSAAIPRTGGTGGGLCGSSAELTGAYKINTPTGLRIDS